MSESADITKARPPSSPSTNVEESLSSFDLSDFIARLTRGESLSRPEASRFLECLLDDEATDEQIATALLALGRKGETVDELVGIAMVMRARAIRVNAHHET